MKTIQLKTDWSEITFNEFQQIDQIINADINETYKMSNILSLLSGESLEYIENLPLRTFNTLVSKISFLQTPLPRIEHKDSYIINGKEYVLKANISDITTAQYVDYQNYTKDKNCDYTQIMSVFLIPKDHNYNDGYDIDEVMKDVGNISIVDFNAICFFLRTQSAALLLIMKDSLLKGMKMKRKEKRKLSHQWDNTVSSLLYWKSLD